jgi:hypothetical protein
MAKKYDSITVNVTEHPGSRSVYLVGATRYAGNDWDQDDTEEIRGRKDALDYAVTNAEYYQDKYPGASVIVIDPDGSEYWPTKIGKRIRAMRRKPIRKNSRRRSSRRR